MTTQLAHFSEIHEEEHSSPNEKYLERLHPYNQTINSRRSPLGNKVTSLNLGNQKGEKVQTRLKKAVNSDKKRVIGNSQTTLKQKSLSPTPQQQKIKTKPLLRKEDKKIHHLKSIRKEIESLESFSSISFSKENLSLQCHDIFSNTTKTNPDEVIDLLQEKERYRLLYQAELDKNAKLKRDYDELKNQGYLDLVLFKYNLECLSMKVLDLQKSVVAEPLKYDDDFLRDDESII